VVVWSFCALLLWLFVLAVSSVFGLNVAGQRTTGSFMFVLPLLIGGMGGGLVLNVILNLNKIGQHVALRNTASSPVSSAKIPRRWLLGVPTVLILVAASLFGADHYTRLQKEQLLLQDAQTSATAFDTDLKSLSTLPWGKELAIKAHDMLELMSKQNRQFPHVTLLIQEPVRGRPAVLELGRHPGKQEEPWDEANKISLVRGLSTEEREYMQSIFAGETMVYRYTANDGSYELFFPIQWGEKRRAILYFSDRLRYGKISS
jgi:hypothetical protein